MRRPGEKIGTHRYVMDLAHRGELMFTHVEGATKRSGGELDFDRASGMLRARGSNWIVSAMGRLPDQNFGLIVQIDRPITDDEFRAAARSIEPLRPFLELLDEEKLRIDYVAQTQVHRQRDGGWIELSAFPGTPPPKFQSWLVARGFQRGERDSWAVEDQRGGGADLVVVDFKAGFLRADLNPEGWSGVPPRFLPPPLP